ncbi:ThiF family adenylyltransferase [Pseudonocardia nematodicida]|uniref:ThiF family adenylyltransferase n=1 Tax=Pseudonocardia nematodicida TaxID=1206997 RepID=A0ABV1KG08_9PSEU
MTGSDPVGGHELAARQLHALAATSDGAIEVVEDAGPSTGLSVSLDTSGVERGAGIRLRQRERFRLTVPETFPFQPPRVAVEHRRWAGTPHVQWGRTLCLYGSISVEWVSGDGIRGLIGRLATWLDRAAAGELDPQDQPLHPPVAYTSREGGTVIVHPDLAAHVPWPESTRSPACSAATTATPDIDPAADPPAPASPPLRLVLGWSRYRPGPDGGRIDVLDWLTADEAVDRVLAPVPEDQQRHLLVLAVLLDTDLGWEYPAHARDLSAGLAEAGLARDRLLGALMATARLNRALSHATEHDPDPVLVLLGTPARRVDGRRLAHLAAWRFDDLGSDITSALSSTRRLHDQGDAEMGELHEEIREIAHRWLDSAQVCWSRVHEKRPEVTRRRDRRTSATWLAGRRVLLLGAGAIGAPVAEQVVRAGVSELVVLDNGAVTPGILVRQPYTDADIGTAKATALAAHLNALDTTHPVLGLVRDATRLFVSSGSDPLLEPSRFDLVIDATADVATRAALELARRTRRAAWPPTATMLVGHRATLGVSTLCLRGASGSGHDILRRLALHGRGPGAGTWGDVVNDLFPNPPRTEVFLPEPGCSAPTFVGSATQLAALSAGMLEATTQLLGAAYDPDTQSDDARATDATSDSAPGAVLPMTAVAVRTPEVVRDGGHRRGGTTVIGWPNDLHTRDVHSGFEVRIAAAAAAAMRTETRRGNRVRGSHIETGGMLLGSFDDATRVISVDLATGPSPDSRLSASFFDHGVEGTQEVLDEHLARSGGLIGYVGLWHTHPEGPALPSAVDEAAIATLTSLAPRALMLILGGPAPTWRQWRDGDGAPELYGRLEHAGNHRGPREIRRPDRRALLDPGGGPTFLGGLREQAAVASPLGPGPQSGRSRRWGWPWLQRR